MVFCKFCNYDYKNIKVHLKTKKHNFNVNKNIGKPFLNNDLINLIYEYTDLQTCDNINIHFFNNSISYKNRINNCYDFFHIIDPNNLDYNLLIDFITSDIKNQFIHNMQHIYSHNARKNLFILIQIFNNLSNIYDDPNFLDDISLKILYFFYIINFVKKYFNIADINIDTKYRFINIIDVIIQKKKDFKKVFWDKLDDSFKKQYFSNRRFLDNKKKEFYNISL